MEISVKTAEASMDELATLLPEYPTVIVGKLATKSPRMKSLLAKSSVKIVELKKGVFSYKATDPLLIKGVRIYCTELDQAAKFINIRAINMGGSLGARKRGYRPKGMEYLYVPLDSYGIGFEVEVNVAKAVIPVTKIEVTGYSLQQLDEFAETLQKGIDIRIGLDKFITEYRAEFVDLTDELAIAKEDLDKVSNQSAKISSEVNLVIEELAGIELKRSGIVAEMEKLAEANRASENAKEQLEGELKALNATMGETRFQLKELISKKRLISDEYSDFVTEGRGQAVIYGWLSVAPIAGALVVLGFLLNSGWNFAEIAVSTPSEAYAHLLQRAPYTLATVATFSLLVKVAYMLITKMIQIHGDRLTLAKLLVIARDTVVASSVDLEMDDEEIFNQRVRLKMKLLRQYLKMDDEVEVGKKEGLQEIIDVAKDVLDKSPILKKGAPS